MLILPEKGAGEVWSSLFLLKTYISSLLNGFLFWKELQGLQMYTL